MATFEKLDNGEVKFDIIVPAETFTEGLVKAYKKQAKRYHIPGFRKGKAPRKMIEKHYGDGVFYEPAFEEVYWDPYIEAVKKADVIPVAPPSIEIDEIGEGQPLHFLATVAVRPEFKVYKKDYKGVKIPKIEYEVTDEQIDNELSAQQERLARYIEVERPVEEGDQINLDYSGSIDGVKFDGGTAENQLLQIGAGQFIPGFEEQMIGKNVNDSFDITVTFPEEYYAEELSGKDAVFAITINEIKRKELPDLDDEFAKDMSDFDTLDELRADLRAKLEESAAERAKRELRASLMEKLVEIISFPLPEVMIDSQVDRVIEDMRYRMSAQGMSMEDYLGYTNSDMNQFREQLRPDAEKRVRADLILANIVKNEDIEASEERIEEEIEAIAKNVNKSVEETKQLLSERDMESIKQDLALNAGMDFLLENAKFVEKEVEEKETKEK